MHLSFRRMFLLFICLGVSALFGSVRAQTEKVITIRMVDNRNGMLIPSSNYLVRINHQKEEHGDWITKNEDGSGKLTLPPDAEVFAIHATYDSATAVYFNCDSDKERGSSEKAPSEDRWYPVSAILATGVVAPNNCVGKKVQDKDQAVAKPGEFVFFVRLRTPKERLFD